MGFETILLMHPRGCIINSIIDLQCHLTCGFWDSLRCLKLFHVFYFRIFSSQVNSDVVNKSVFKALETHYEKLSADYVSLQNSYQSKSTDYEAVKKQYAKLASDFANLHKENKEHAMESLHISTKCENFERVSNFGVLSSQV